MKIFRLVLVCMVLFPMWISGCQNAQPVQMTHTHTPPIPTLTNTPAPTQGHASIRGRIIQSYGEHQPAADLQLHIKGLSATATTDQNGAFTFTDLPAGNWTISGKALSFTASVATVDQILDVGLIKVPVEQVPDAYTQLPPPMEDLNQLMGAGEHIDWGTAITYSNWSRPSLSKQQTKIWSKSPYQELPESFLRWWFKQPAMVYNTMDILDQNGSQGYASDPQFSEWLELLGAGDIDLINDRHFWEGDYNEDLFYPHSYSDVYTGKIIEVWLMDYRAWDVIKSGDHYFVDVYPGGGFNIIRFPGNDGKPFQVHLLQDGREIARLPRQCIQPGDPDCSQNLQTGLPFYPSPTPTLLAYTPQPTPQPPSLNALQIINRTNINELVPVWRYEPADSTSTAGSFEFTFSPDGKKMAMIEDNQISLMDLETAEIVQMFTLDALFVDGYQPEIYSVIFSPNGSRLAGLTGAGPILWDVSTGTLLWKAEQLNFIDLYTSMNFSPNGDVLITTSIAADSDIRVWSAETGQVIKELGRNNQWDAAISPDGKRLYTADRFSSDQAIHIWDTETWQHIGAVHVEWEANSIVLSPNGEIMLVGSNDFVEGPEVLLVYAVDGWKLLGEIEDRDPIYLMPREIFTYPTLNNDGSIVAFAARDHFGYSSVYIQLWGTTNQQRLVNLDWNFPMPVWAVRFSPDGRLLATQSENGTMVFWGVPSP